MPESPQEMLARVERLTTNSPGAYFSLAPIDRAALCYVLESRAKLLKACKAAEHRYRSMWFDLKGPKPVSNSRGEWGMLMDAIAHAEGKEQDNG